MNRQTLFSNSLRVLIYAGILGFVFFGLAFASDLIGQEDMQAKASTPTTMTWQTPEAKTFSVTKTKTSPNAFVTEEDLK